MVTFNDYLCACSLPLCNNVYIYSKLQNVQYLRMYIIANELKGKFLTSINNSSMNSTLIICVDYKSVAADLIQFSKASKI